MAQQQIGQIKLWEHQKSKVRIGKKNRQTNFDSKRNKYKHNFYKAGKINPEIKNVRYRIHKKSVQNVRYRMQYKKSVQNVRYRMQYKKKSVQNVRNWSYIKKICLKMSKSQDTHGSMSSTSPGRTLRGGRRIW